MEIRMRIPAALSLTLSVLFSGCWWFDENTHEEYCSSSRQQLEEAHDDSTRLRLLPTVAKCAFEDGELEYASEMALEALALAHQIEVNSDYGISVHEANIVLGRLALLEGNKISAIAHLQAATQVSIPAPPRWFQPDFDLARTLLEIGERKHVLQYLEECKPLWKGGRPCLEQWQKQIAERQIPDFYTWDCEI
jgi:hypothetical protein